MLSFRFAVVSVSLMFAIACGGGYSSSSTAPSPTPASAPTPGTSPASVGIPVGAASLGGGAFIPDELSVAVGTTVTWMNTDAVVPHIDIRCGGLGLWRCGAGRPVFSRIPDPGHVSVPLRDSPGNGRNGRRALKGRPSLIRISVLPRGRWWSPVWLAPSRRPA